MSEEAEKNCWNFFERGIFYLEGNWGKTTGLTSVEGERVWEVRRVGVFGEGVGLANLYP